jgi:N-terminal half of MaoC dehydratase
MTIDRFPVEAGQIMLFARAIGDPNPVYHDEAYAAGTESGGIIAPPTFVQASAQYDDDYPLRPAFGRPWFGSGRHDTGVEAAGSASAGGQSLHAEQHYEYHRQLRPGDVLRAITEPGRTWEKDGRSGKLVFRETVTRYVDGAGTPVITARSVSVRTEGPAR